MRLHVFYILQALFSPSFALPFLLSSRKYSVLTDYGSSLWTVYVSCIQLEIPALWNCSLHFLALDFTHSWLPFYPALSL